MRIVLSAAMSADGHIDDSTPERLVISSPEDWQEVYALRAGCDAILVGAGTLRKDNPSLVIRDPELRRQREERGESPDIVKVAVSGSGTLDPDLRFFTEGAGEKVLFTTREVSGDIARLARVIRRPKLNAAAIFDHLNELGIDKLMVEGGTSILSMFLGEGIWDEFRLAVGPFFVADPLAPRLVAPGNYPEMNLDRVDTAGQTAVMYYTNGSRYREDCEWMAEAISISRRSVPCDTCYRVGAVIVTRSGRSFGGYTHGTAPDSHAEEEAITKALAAGEELRGATIYTTMEPCTKRSSRPVSCTSHIIGHGFARVVFAYREPARFVRCESVEQLGNAGIEVSEMSAFAAEVACINSHVLSKQ